MYTEPITETIYGLYPVNIYTKYVYTYRIRCRIPYGMVPYIVRTKNNNRMGLVYGSYMFRTTVQEELFRVKLQVHREKPVRFDICCRYATAVSRLSSLYHDQPETPQERAAFWVEFVARHKDARHLRSPGELMSWAARWMVDDVALITVTFVILVYLFRRLRSHSKVPPTKAKIS